MKLRSSWLHGKVWAKQKQTSANSNKHATAGSPSPYTPEGLPEGLPEDLPERDEVAIPTSQALCHPPPACSLFTMSKLPTPTSQALQHPPPARSLFDTSKLQAPQQGKGKLKANKAQTRQNALPQVRPVRVFQRVFQNKTGAKLHCKVWSKVERAETQRTVYRRFDQLQL